MEAILASKLDCSTSQQGMPVTPLSFLRVMSAVSRAAAARLEVTPLPRAVPPPHLLHQLEILVCDSSTLKFRPCELALALLCTEFQQLCAKHPSNTTALMGFVTELQKYCNIQASHFVTLLSEVVAILERYNAEGQVPHRQRLVWKLSNRTLRHLRPTDRLRPTLPKICEEAASAAGDKACQLRLRSASECSLESECSDSDTGYKAGGSDTESDVEMEEPRSWARIVAAS
jgi:cyclin G2